MRGLLLCSVLVATLGCVTVVQQEEFGEDLRWEYRVRESTYNGRRASYLSYRGGAVGSYYSTIVAGGRQFELQIATAKLGFEGYRLTDEPRLRPAGIDPALDPEEAKRGWYLAAFAELRRGTPADWVWVQRENLTAWVEPGKLTRLAKRFDLMPILRPADETGLKVGIGVTTIFRF
jgi:hypothetical protein